MRYAPAIPESSRKSIEKWIEEGKTPYLYVMPKIIFELRPLSESPTPPTPMPLTIFRQQWAYNSYEWCFVAIRLDTNEEICRSHTRVRVDERETSK